MIIAMGEGCGGRGRLGKEDCKLQENGIFEQVVRNVIFEPSHKRGERECQVEHGKVQANNLYKGPEVRISRVAEVEWAGESGTR